MKRFVITLAITCSALCVMGQRKVQHIPYADLSPFHVGFSIGVQTQDFILTQSGNVFQEKERWFAEIPSYSPGLNISLIGDLFLTSYLNLRITPSLWLGEKKTVFREEWTGKDYTEHIRNNYIALPIHLKFAAPRFDNRRPYFIFGGYGAIDISPTKETALPTNRLDYGVEIGGGYTIYLPYFRLSPEVKFGFGLANLYPTKHLDKQHNELQKYTESISGVKQRFITLTFHFE